MDELYRDQILEHYKRPHNFGRLEEPDLEYEDTNPFCGDEQRALHPRRRDVDPQQVEHELLGQAQKLLRRLALELLGQHRGRGG